MINPDPTGMLAGHEARRDAEVRNLHGVQDILRATIRDLEQKITNLTTVAEDAKALAKAAVEREARLREALQETYAHIEGYVDVIDCGASGVRPNLAMKAQHLIREVLATTDAGDGT
jgi:hypothetical protein